MLTVQHTNYHGFHYITSKFTQPVSLLTRSDIDQTGINTFDALGFQKFHELICTITKWGQ